MSQSVFFFSLIEALAAPVGPSRLGTHRTNPSSSSSRKGATWRARIDESRAPDTLVVVDR
jgi:hypothetical protein